MRDRRPGARRRRFGGNWPTGPPSRRSRTGSPARTNSGATSSRGVHRMERTATWRGRGAPPVADLTTLLRVCLELMSRTERAAPYHPAPPDLWQPPAALAGMRRMLGERGVAVPLHDFLPPPTATRSILQRRAALVSTLVAGLELARDHAIRLERHRPFDAIWVGSTGSTLPQAA